MRDLAKYLALDFGTRYLGMAVGEPCAKSVKLLPALVLRGEQTYWSCLKACIKTWGVKAIVLGLPLNMDGTEQKMTARVRHFARCIHDALGLPIHFHDERLSTVEARHQIYVSSGFKRLRKPYIDSVAAALILEGWLDQHC